MPKRPKVEFEWEEKFGVTKCTIDDKFTGTAICNFIDYDMKNRKVGEEIAYNRALIKYLKYDKNNRIIPSLKAVRQVYYSMNQSKKFNSDSYEAKMLRRQIENWEYELSLTIDAIETTEDYIRLYIKHKDEYYQHIRKKRNKVKN